jgi:mono/diheme cytochrome c family protein
MSIMCRAILAWVGVTVAGAGYLHLQAAPTDSASAPVQVAAAAAVQRSQPPVVARAQAPASTPAPVPSPAEARALLDKYCVRCHSAKLNRAYNKDVTLDTLDLADVPAASHVWEMVARKVRTGAMPPAGSPRPDNATLVSFVSRLESDLDRAAAAKPNPGRPVVHRLNRLEYTNAIRDLFALDIDSAALLPVDESGYGFDNIGDILSVSPGLLQRYMFAAVKISRLALGDTTIRPATETYKIPLDLVQNTRMSNDLPFRSRGGAAFRHTFPVDGDYTLRIALNRDVANNGIIGIDFREQIDVRLDGKRVTLFTVGGDCVGSKEPKCLATPGVQMNNEYEQTADKALFVRFPAKAGNHLLGVTFVERVAAIAEGAGGGRGGRGGGVDEMMSIRNVEIAGPLEVAGPGDTVSRQRVFVCRPSGVQDEEACATKILSTLARRAYRRPVTDADTQGLLGFYRQARKQGTFESGIQFAIEALLVSPNFLLRIERDPDNAVAGQAYRISDIELASRLSFFLWNTIPDDELLDVAARGKLSDPKILEQQVRRLAADDRAVASMRNFAFQWLYLRDLRSVRPDLTAYPEFDDNLREAFERETELLIETQMRADRGVIELLTADHTFVNERLARFYGIPNVFGSHFRRVPVTDPNRIGLLGHGSMLTVTSFPNRTSPVGRGKYMLSNILGTPPPPPPPDIPPFPENGEGNTPTSVRARMELHRKNPVCASCHVRMDPIGFALENFDGIGKWRNFDGKDRIDASGGFPDGVTFNGPAELRKVLVDHYQEQFIGTMTEKLLTYALGRGVEHYDMPAVRKIMRDAAPTGSRWSGLILGVIKSTPFQMRTVQAPIPEPTAPPNN